MRLNCLKENDLVQITHLEQYICNCIVAPFPDHQYDGRLDFFRFAQAKEGYGVGYRWVDQFNRQLVSGRQEEWVITAYYPCDTREEANYWMDNPQDIPWVWYRKDDNRFKHEFLRTDEENEEVLPF